MLELLDQQLQQLQLYCRHTSNHLLAGHYHSTFKGQGIEFDEVRQYALGDDIRAIDWNVTARTGDLHIKRFHEERELNLIFVIDQSPSFSCSSGAISRPFIAAKLCGLLGAAALANNDRIGLLSFSDTVDQYITPARGRSQLMRCLRQVLQPAKNSRYTSVASAMSHLSQLKLKRSIVVIISDFLSQHSATEQLENYSESLAVLNRQHEVLAIAIDSPNEVSLNKSGLITLTDAESGQQQTVDLADKNLTSRFSIKMQQRLAERSVNFAHAGVDLLSHQLNADPVTTLLNFFQTRNSRIEGETGG